MYPFHSVRMAERIDALRDKSVTIEQVVVIIPLQQGPPNLCCSWLRPGASCPTPRIAVSTRSPILSFYYYLDSQVILDIRYFIPLATAKRWCYLCVFEPAGHVASISSRYCWRECLRWGRTRHSSPQQRPPWSTEGGSISDSYPYSARTYVLNSFCSV